MGDRDDGILTGGSARAGLRICGAHNCSTLPELVRDSPAGRGLRRGYRRSSGASKGTFYIYFDSRDELMEALYGDLADKAAGALDLVPLPTGPAEWPPFLDGLTDRTIDFIVAHRDLHEVSRRTGRMSTSKAGARCRRWIGSNDTADGDPLRRSPRRCLASRGQISARLLFDLLHAAGHLALKDGAQEERIRTVTRELVRGAFLR